MEIGYWIVATILAAFNLFAGGSKLLRTQEQLAPMMAWAGEAVPMRGVRAIGAVEVLGAVGLLLPPLTGVLPWLAIVAALGFAVLQVLAAAFHLSRGEARDTPLNWITIAVSLLAAWLGSAVV